MKINPIRLVGFPTFINLKQVVQNLCDTESYLREGHRWYSTNVQKMVIEEEPPLKDSFELISNLKKAFVKGFESPAENYALFTRKEEVQLNLEPVLQFLTAKPENDILEVLYHLQNFMREFLHQGNILDYKRAGEFVHELYLDVLYLSEGKGCSDGR